ncbi:MAG: hypothetical protein HQM13_20260 [SAR324 cluster bacterium]|nr:hypothetical protein [SAR324 cluster bacterium]
MKEEFLQAHSIAQCFILAFRIYRIYFIPIMILSISLLIPSVVTGLLGLEIEHIVFFVTIRLTEAAMTLGLVALLFQPVFPAIGILKSVRSRLFFGAVHVAILQFIIFLTGSMFAVLPFPLNMILFLILIGSIFVFSLSQTIYILEGERGFRALVASFRLVQSNASKTILTIIFLGTAKLVLFSFLLVSFLPELNLGSPENLEKVENLMAILQTPEVIQALRWSQYLGYLLLYPFASLVLVLLYIDLKLSHSGIEESSLFQTVAHLLRHEDAEPASDKIEDQHNSH